MHHDIEMVNFNNNNNNNNSTSHPTTPQTPSTPTGLFGPLPVIFSRTVSVPKPKSLKDEFMKCIKHDISLSPVLQELFSSCTGTHSRCFCCAEPQLFP